MFRFWKLGEAKKNNGVLLLVAPAEHKVRIEVGYGLEGTLTDALSSVIISSAIVPRFKANDYSGGIQRGVEGIIAVLTTDASEWRQKADVRADDLSGDFNKLFPILFLVLLIFFIWYLIHQAMVWAPVQAVRAVDAVQSSFRPWAAPGVPAGAAVPPAAVSAVAFPVAAAGRAVAGRRESVMEFSKEDHEAVSTAIQQAEKRTSGQIVCVLAHASSDHAHIPILWATALALIAPCHLSTSRRGACSGFF